MNNSISTRQPGDGTREVRLVTKGLGFLALLTGIVYLRVIIGDVLLGLKAGNVAWTILLSLLFLLTGTLGLLGSWRWEGAGGLAALLSGLGLGATVYLASGWSAAFFYSSPFLIAGGLCLACWWQTKKKASGIGEWRSEGR
jgi:hypothetical protein